MVWAEKLSIETGTSLGYAKREAERFCYKYTGLAHMLVGILDLGDNKVSSLLQKLDIDTKVLAGDIEKIIRQNYKEQEINPRQLKLSSALVVLMNNADAYSAKLGELQIQPGHLLYAATKILEDRTIALMPEEISACEILAKHGINTQKVDDAYKKE